jgi:hypothetical protein
MSDLPLDAQYELAAKIQQLVIFTGLLSDDEIEALKKMRANLKDQNSNLSAVSGVITPMAESEHKIARNHAMIKRIDALVAIHESNYDLRDADNEFQNSKDNHQKVLDMFGLAGL